MLSLSEAGWAAPRIAAHLGYHAATVRRFFHAFAAEGVAPGRRDRPGPPPDSPRRAEVGAALTDLLRRPRAWSAPQLAAALGEGGIALSAPQVRRPRRRR